MVGHRLALAAAFVLACSSSHPQQLTDGGRTDGALGDGGGSCAADVCAGDACGSGDACGGHVDCAVCRFTAKPLGSGGGAVLAAGSGTELTLLFRDAVGLALATQDGSSGTWAVEHVVGSDGETLCAGALGLAVSPDLTRWVTCTTTGDAGLWVAYAGESSAWAIERVTPSYDNSVGGAIATLADGTPVVAFAANGVSLAHRIGPGTWSTAVAVPFGLPAMQGLALAADPATGDTSLALAWQRDQLYYATASGSGVAGSVEVADPAGGAQDSGGAIAIAFDATDRAHVGYHQDESDQARYVAHAVRGIGGAWTVDTVAAYAGGGDVLSLAAGSGGVALAFDTADPSERFVLAGEHAGAWLAQSLSVNCVESGVVVVPSEGSGGFDIYDTCNAGPQLEQLTRIADYPAGYAASCAQATQAMCAAGCTCGSASGQEAHCCIGPTCGDAITDCENVIGPDLCGDATKDPAELAQCSAAIAGGTIACGSDDAIVPTGCALD